MALTNPTAAFDAEFSVSVKVTEPLKNAIIQQSATYSTEVSGNQVKARSKVCKEKIEISKQVAESMKQSRPSRPL